MTLYPFNEHRVQVNADRCPAPWCDLDLSRRPVWFTAILFEDHRYASFAAAKHDPYGTCVHKLKTCRRAPCIAWARLRADDLRGGPDVDPVYVASMWLNRPQPEPPEEMQRERFDRLLRESIDRIQNRLRVRPA